MNNGIKLAALACIFCFVLLRLMVRRVWYRKEHARPGYFRHTAVIRTVDFFSWVVLCASFFLVLNLGRWKHALLAMVLLVGCDLGLRKFYLYWEARRLCIHKPQLDMQHAKDRLRQRVAREMSN